MEGARGERILTKVHICEKHARLQSILFLFPYVTQACIQKLLYLQLLSLQRSTWVRAPQCLYYLLAILSLREMAIQVQNSDTLSQPRQKKYSS
jgi:hypothetical protein